MKTPRMKQICDKYDIINYDDYQYFKDLTAPVVTIAMLSYKRYDRLIKTLRQLLRNKDKLNICLRVQGCENLTEKQVDKITRLCTLFYGYDLQFTKKNLGSGIPRHDVLNRALHVFNTPYIMTTDDDMIWKPNSIMAQISVFSKLPEYGALGSVCKPHYARYIVKDNEKSAVPIDDELVDTDMMGSATTIYRREVFDTCEYDKEYTIGLGDFDLCMQMKKNNWKLGILDIPELHSFNDWDASASDYIKDRYNKVHINNSRKRFKKKWGFEG